ncbi:hypothetical protein CH254_15920 [Rhodococcus sp. 06-412-2C]|uniref:tripartite tricarboxylate transporter TctB family protein n=1 Tax=unclassified Rhodococcus (in: high G+C Gram-positive bacteria) TaxID=192944 RepID=UPI000B9BC305|nr:MULTISPECIES: tripartite tricarboxylate transporter TctB family protein [unclassified Rhodococcus (in: high G+C Gram-positive bacteria)]OZC87168.1 hypothetical protein CH254_15920 [Rhodococcus sp. 06-412-2C]OZD00608.1 hypothetical protein CH279_06285 [Rhodococcus sp. 06-412-2B]
MPRLEGTESPSDVEQLPPPTASSLGSDDGERGLDALAVPVLLVFVGGFLAYGLLTMDVPPTASWPGPTFFPVIVTGLIFVVAAALTAQIVVAHQRARADHVRDTGPGTDWKALGIVVGSFVVFVAILQPLGWIVSAAVLFWGVAHGLGSTKPRTDIVVALGASCAVQLAFSAGLGLRLPAGIFGWF